MIKPRLVHLITRLIAGGAQENTVLSCRALKERYDTTLVTGPPEGLEGSLVDAARRAGIHTVVFPDLVRPVRPVTDARAIWRLRSLLSELRPDIVHTHSSKAGILGRAAAWLAGIRVIVHTNHGLPFYDYQPWFVRRAYWAVERLATSVTHRVVCVGEEMRRKAIAARLGPARLFEVVYSGIEIDAFLSAKSARERLGIQEDAKVVGVVSRLAGHKGHRFLIDACPEGTHLLVVGGGEARGDLEKQVSARGLSATFTGHVDPSEVPDLIASMDVLVHPSLWEGLPRSVVQALLVGRPVAAFDCDGAREVVIDGVTGRLVPPKSVAGLRAAIEEILALPDRGRGWAEEGRTRARRRFEWRAVGENLDRIYKAVLSERGLNARESL